MSHALQPVDTKELLAVSVEEIADLISKLPSADIESVKLQLEMTSAVSSSQSDAIDFAEASVPQSLSTLTERETEVLILIASGYTRRDIGGALNISKNTAATHIASLYRKLDICSIAEATHLAIRHRVVKLM